MPTDQPSEAELIAQAQAGHRLAFERLLVRNQLALTKHIRQRVPTRMQSVIDAEDVLQETFSGGWAAISEFRPSGNGGFYAWLVRIAENRLLDAIRAQRARKRGGGRPALDGSFDPELTGLLSLLSAHERTPSRSVARREALEALQVALPRLKDDFRRVLQLRYLEGRTVADTAVQMNRTEWAVQKLTARALARLRAALGDASGILSH